MRCGVFIDRSTIQARTCRGLAGDQDKFLNTGIMAGTCCQEMSRAELIHEIIVSGMTCFCKSGAMKYERNALHCGGKCFGPGAVALGKLNLHPFKPAHLPEISHQAGYLITIPEKSFDKMTAYKAGSACNQYPS
jgi:hypothetical protein